MSWNHVTIEGRLLTDPEPLRWTVASEAVTRFEVAAARPRGFEPGKYEDDHCPVQIDCFGELAERVCASLTEGHRVVVSGRLSRHSWENPHEGTSGTVLKVRAVDVALSLRGQAVSVPTVPVPTTKEAGR